MLFLFSSLRRSSNFPVSLFIPLPSSYLPFSSLISFFRFLLLRFSSIPSSLISLSFPPSPFSHLLSPSPVSVSHFLLAPFLFSHVFFVSIILFLFCSWPSLTSFFLTWWYPNLRNFAFMICGKYIIIIRADLNIKNMYAEIFSVFIR